MGIIDSLISGAFGIGTSAMNNKANLKAQREANQTNLHIAQMNNDYNQRQFEKQLQYNYDMFNKQSDFSRETMRQQQAFETAQQDKQNQFNIDMWNMQNEYNSPEQQRARAEAAGYNPYMMIGGTPAGSVTSATASAGNASTPSAGSVSPPTATPVSVQPVLSDLSGVTTALQNTVGNIIASKQMNADTELKASQVENNRIENKYLGARLIAEINEKMSNAKSNEAKAAYQEILNQFAADQQFADLQAKNANIAVSIADVELRHTQNAYLSLQKSLLPQQVQVQVAEGYAKIALMAQQQKLTESQFEHELVKMVKTQAESVGIKLNNKVLDGTVDSLIQLRKNEASKSGFNDGPEGLFGVPNLVWQTQRGISRDLDSLSQKFKSWFTKRRAKRNRF